MVYLKYVYIHGLESSGTVLIINCHSWKHSFVFRRLFRRQPHSHGPGARFFWATVEGIFVIGLPIFDLRSFRSMHGNNYGGMFPPYLAYILGDA